MFIVRPFRLASLAVFVCVALPISAQIAPHVVRYRQILDNRQQIIDGWNRDVTFEIALTVSVCVCGALIAAIQVTKKGWTTGATAALGAFTTVLTGMNAIVFPADYRTLRQSAIDARELLEELSTTVDDYAAVRTPQDRQTTDAEFLKKLSQLDAVIKRVLKGSPAEVSHNESNGVAERATFNWSRVVLAASVSGTPSWANHPPADQFNLFFVGEGEGASLSEAKNNSVTAALERAVQSIKPESQLDLTALRSLIEKASSVEDSSFQFNKAAGRFRYFTLLRVSKEIEHLDTASLELSGSVHSSKTTRVKIVMPGRSSPIALSYGNSLGLLALTDAGEVLQVDTKTSATKKLFQCREPFNLACDRVGLKDTVVVVQAYEEVGPARLLTLFVEGDPRGLTQSVLLNGRIKGLAENGRAAKAFFSDPVRSQIYSADIFGRRIKNVTPIVATSLTSTLGVLATDTKSGKLFVADDKQGEILVIDPNLRKPLSFAKNVWDVRAMATDSRSQRLLVVSGHRVLGYPVSGGPEQALVDQGLKTPSGVTIDSDGAIWISDLKMKAVVGPY